MWTIEKNGVRYYRYMDILAEYGIKQDCGKYRIARRLANMHHDKGFFYLKHSGHIFISEALANFLRPFLANFQADHLYFYAHKNDGNMPWHYGWPEKRKIKHEQYTIDNPETAKDLWVAVVNKIISDLKSPNRYLKEVAADYCLQEHHQKDFNDVLTMADMLGTKEKIQCLAREVISKK